MEIVVDAVLIVLAVVAFAVGWSNGAIRQAGSLVGLIVGLWAGLALAPIVVGWFAAIGWTGLSQRTIVAAIVILVCASIAYGLATALAGMLGKLVRHGPIRWLDSLAGSILGLLTWAVLVWLFAGFAQATNLAAVMQAASTSRVVATLDAIAPLPSSTVLGAVDDALSQAGLPQVFEGGESIHAIAAPDATVPAPVNASADSVVKVLAAKPGCGVDSEGSGWVEAPGRVVTNAHVVAGSDAIFVKDVNSSRSLRATLVAFDPERDLAVLQVSGLSEKPLALGKDLATGESAFAAGYPGDGAYTVSPERVREKLVARGGDIYQHSTVDREIYALRGSVRPGNSGGPLFDASGKVAGVVFARSTTDPETGYALTLAELRPVLATVGTAPVDSGGCATE
ncbi:MarP family serine protease [Diaminobutyricibacter sp. McL0608]|uniref:MarP family serine protease n=1 Tax=Leifsonia sp. McL0608 TaxID=3143537 RepID=UPI0031F300DE